MAIITISRWCCSKGQEIAEKVAEKLGYSCMSREVLLQASKEFHIPEFKLDRALHDAPSIFDRFSHGRERYVAFIRQAFLEGVQADNAVYHGLAGHFFVEGVRHVLKVRIFADIEERARVELERENLSREEALALLRKDDEERRRWSAAVHGVDPADIRLYDLVFYLLKLRVEDVVEVICMTAQLPQFQATPESQRVLDNLVLAAQVKSAIVKLWPEAEVKADEGEVIVSIDAPLTHHVEGSLARENKLRKRVSKLISPLPGVKDVRVRVGPILEI
ncbi:MAG: cytidylate kinase-like family protein [bacterium]